MGKILPGNFMKFAFFTFLFFIIIPFASAALPTPDVTFIPSDISINSSFLLVVDPKVEDSVRISWLSPDTLPAAYGQIPKVGDKWVCYFSDTDTKNTCGPSPFRVSNIGFSPFTFEVNTTDSSGDTGGKSMGVYAGGIKLNSQITTDVEKKTVYVSVWPIPGGDVTGISYVTYYAGNLSAVPGKDGSLVYDSPSGAYRKNITLDIGEYYMAFSAPTTGSDYGGGVARVSMALGAGGNGDGEGEYVDVDPVSLNILINRNQVYEKSNFRITNLKNETLTSMSVVIPETTPVDVNDFLGIQLDNNTLDPLDYVYFSVVLENVVNSMEINTQALLKSNNTWIGYIPVDIRVSVKNESGDTMTSCEGKSDMSYCYGGICCDETCRVKSDCCDDGDCASDERCESYKCVKTEGALPDIQCTTGTCYTGETSCPAGEEWTGTCRVDEVSGVCCEVEVNECEEQPNGTYCTDGICCDELCIIGDCCDDLDCSAGYTCSNNYCMEIEAPEFDFTIPIIIAIVVVAGAGIWFYLKKKKGGGEEEFEEGSEEFEEEFY